MVVRGKIGRKGETITSEGVLYRLERDWSPSGDPVTCRILWDTGSPISLLSDAVAKKIGTARTMGYPIMGISGAVQTQLCSAMLAIPADGGRQVWERKDVFHTFPAEQMPDIDIIIGLDIILDGRLVIEALDGIPAMTFTI